MSVLFSSELYNAEVAHWLLRAAWPPGRFWFGSQYWPCENLNWLPTFKHWKTALQAGISGVLWEIISSKPKIRFPNVRSRLEARTRRLPLDFGQSSLVGHTPCCLFFSFTLSGPSRHLNLFIYLKSLNQHKPAGICGLVLQKYRQCCKRGTKLLLNLSNLVLNVVNT